jgi:hypothetical protein
MADKKISALTAATTPLAGTEVLPIVQSNATVKVATNDLTVKNLRAASTTGILQVSGPTAGTTRTMTVPDANFTAARTDAANSFTGNQTLSTDNLIIGTAGKGIDFSANTAAAGMTSELLNWYEHGTFTPTLSFGGASVGVTYDTTYTGGTYSRIGNRVFVSGYIAVTNKGSSTGTARIGGLPFTSAAGNKAYLGASIGVMVGVSFSGQLGLSMDPASSTFVFNQFTEAGVGSVLTNTAFGTAPYGYFSGHYSV